MSTKTTNFEFIKPEKTDPADITSTNENWDKLDEALIKRDKDLSMGGHKITNVAEPTSRSDAATRGFVEDFSIEGSTYVAVDENKDGNVILRPYVADEDALVFAGHLDNKENPHGVTPKQIGAVPGIKIPAFNCYVQLVEDDNDDLECLNPPMFDNVLYRTFERYDGEPVYTLCLDAGALPGTSTKRITPLVGQVGKIISVEVMIDNGKFATKLPYINKDGAPGARFYTDVSTGTLEVVIQTFENLSQYNATIFIKYVE